MKRQIHAVRGHDEIAVAGHDIKLGRGGIREIEFFVQTQQLVFGGRRPGLRGRRTLDMLAALHDEGWITAKARDELSEAYRFLRTIEHRLQMVADEQTQRLPSDEDAAEALRQVLRLSDRESLLEGADRSGEDRAGALRAALRGGAGTRLRRRQPRLHRHGRRSRYARDLAAPRLPRARARGGDRARLAFRPPPGDPERARARGADRARARHCSAALGGTADPDGGARRARPRLRPHAGRGRASHHPAIARSPAASLRRSSRHRAAPCRHGGAIAARARCAHRSRLRHAARRRRGHRSAGAPAHRPAARLTRIFSTASAMRRGRCASSPARGCSPAFSRRRRRARPMPPSRAPSSAPRSRKCAARFEAEHGVVPGAKIAILGLGRLGSARADGRLRSRPRGDLRFRRGAPREHRPAQARRGGLLHAPDAAPRRRAHRADAARPALRGRSAPAPAGRQGARRVAVQGLRRLPEDRGRSLGAHGAHPRPRARRRRGFWRRDVDTVRDGHSRAPSAIRRPCSRTCAPCAS